MQRARAPRQIFTPWKMHKGWIWSAARCGTASGNRDRVQTVFRPCLKRSSTCLHSKRHGGGSFQRGRLHFHDDKRVLFRTSGFGSFPATGRSKNVHLEHFALTLEPRTFVQICTFLSFFFLNICWTLNVRFNLSILFLNISRGVGGEGIFKIHSCYVYYKYYEVC